MQLNRSNRSNRTAACSALLSSWENAEKYSHICLLQSFLRVCLSWGCPVGLSRGRLRCTPLSGSQASLPQNAGCGSLQPLALSTVSQCSGSALGWYWKGAGGTRNALGWYKAEMVRNEPL